MPRLRRLQGAFALWIWLLVSYQATVLLARDLYSVLGIRRQATEDEIKKAYRKAAIKYHPDKNPSDGAKAKFIEVQKAYETLGDTAKRRQYDLTGRDADQQQQPGGGQNHYHGGQFHQFRQRGDFFSQGFRQENIPSETVRLSIFEFRRQVMNSKLPWIIQVYHDRHRESQLFSSKWEAANKDLRGWANLGRIEITKERMLAEQLVTINSRLHLPQIFGVPPNCQSMTCTIRYKGSLEAWDAEELKKFVADHLLSLDFVPDVTARSAARFLSRVPPHKVAALVFSNSGRHASLPVRKAATDAAGTVSVGRVSYTSSDAKFWREEFGVRRWPAMVFFKGPGSKPVVIDGSVTKIDVVQLMREHGAQTVPALRHNTLKDIGCYYGQKQVLGGSAFCAVLIGRPGGLLEESRAALLKVAQVLDDSDPPMEYASATKAYAQSRLKLAWVDASQQPAWCRYHLGSDSTVCSRWHWGQQDVALVVYVAGGGPVYRWAVHERNVAEELREGGPAELALWLSQLVSTSGRMFKESEYLPPALVDMDTPGLLGSMVKRVKKAGQMMMHGDLDVIVAQIEPLLMTMWPALLLVALFIVNAFSGFFSDEASVRTVGEGPNGETEAGEESDDSDDIAVGSDGSPLSIERVCSKKLSAVPRLTKAAALSPKRGDPPFLFLVAVPMGRKGPAQSQAVLNALKLFQRFKAESKFSLAKLRVADEPEWAELVDGLTAKDEGRCVVMVWGPDRKRYQALYPADLERAIIRLDDVLSGGGRWERCQMPPLW